MANTKSQAFNTFVAVVPVITASISCCSSIFLLTRIFKTLHSDAFHIKRTRDHLLIGLTFLDVCGSLGLSFSTYLTPYPNFDGPGTVETCSLQGFLVQLGLGVPLYNASLCIYFVLAVRYSIPDQKLTKWLVPIVHLTILPFILGSAIYGLATEVFNPAGIMGCWAHTVDRTYCEADPSVCGRGQNAKAYQWNFGGIHLIICFVIILLSMIVLYCTVRRIEMRARRWDPSSALSGASRHRPSAHASYEPSVDFSTTSSHCNNNSERTRGLVQIPQFMVSFKVMEQYLASIFWKREESLSNTTMETGLIYSFSFFLAYMPSYILGVVKLPKNGIGYQVLQCLSVIFLPSQGTFNLLIYTQSKWRPWLQQQRQHCCKRKSSSCSGGQSSMKQDAPGECCHNKTADRFNDDDDDVETSGGHPTQMTGSSTFCGSGFHSASQEAKLEIQSFASNDDMEANQQSLASFEDIAIPSHVEREQMDNNDNLQDNLDQDQVANDQSTLDEEQADGTQQIETESHNHHENHYDQELAEAPPTKMDATTKEQEHDDGVAKI
ncbi:expressed unknown protein [Seminavis robusta]|uniref:Uncharacterized protein n=1 Tax=Seminavis robusta TaxID=568900 RepID=A0A9N8E6E7_9STRA|nr:expressed unknown protein [Seminavis robusta]|eukprot:Sro712_g191310.1 n/a (550) ;mRNA; f:9057-10909